MEDGELVAVVLSEPDLRVVELELEAVRGRRSIAAGLVVLGDAVPQQHEAARFVRSFGLGVRDEPLPDLGGDHHQTVRSIAVSTSSASQKSADR